jgi:hemerythrin-like domain-containing protein
MKRDPSLIPLSHQHHNGLALCVLTDRSLAADSSAPNVERIAGRVVDHFDVEMANHFDLEESVLFPLLEALPLVVELRRDHCLIRQLVDNLRITPIEADLRSFAAAVRQHIRKEEGELFEHAQQVLPRETLDRIGAEFALKAVRVCVDPL